MVNVKFAFGFALVPIYNVMCDVLGINGKTGGATAASVAAVDQSRTITVQFLASRNEQLPWKFIPPKPIRVHPGENAKIEYFAENDSGKTMTVQAVPSVTPGLAAKYLKKTECFCFNQQTLANKKTMEMPLLFHLDRDLPSNIHVVTLSYTLFDVTGAANQKQVKNTGKLSG